MKENKNNEVTLTFTTEDGIKMGAIGTFTGTPEIKIEDDIHLIIGKHNATNQTLYWIDDLDDGYEIGDYAIVENKNDYDLIKIVGAVATQQKYLRFITGVNVNKKIVKIVERNEIRED